MRIFLPRAVLHKPANSQQDLTLLNCSTGYADPALAAEADEVLCPRRGVARPVPSDIEAPPLYSEDYLPPSHQARRDSAYRTIFARTGQGEALS